MNSKLLLFSLLFFGVLSASVCYQETANVNTSCGGLATGSYTCTGTWDSTYTCAKTYDGSYSTNGMADSYNLAYVKVIYSKPAGAVSAYVYYKNYISTGNVSIPAACWNGQNATVTLNITSYYGSGAYLTNMSCYTGTSWEWIYNQSYLNNNGALFYDERIYWIFSDAPPVLSNISISPPVIHAYDVVNCSIVYTDSLYPNISVLAGIAINGTPSSTLYAVNSTYANNTVWIPSFNISNNPVGSNISCYSNASNSYSASNRSFTNNITISTAPITQLDIWNGSAWITYNSTNRMSFRCPGSFPVYCTPTNQNNNTAQPIIRNTNGGTDTSTYQQMKVNVSWGVDGMMKCGTAQDYPTAINLTTDYQNYSTSNLAYEESNYLYCWLYVTAVSAEFPRTFTLTVEDGYA